MEPHTEARTAAPQDDDVLGSAVFEQLLQTEFEVEELERLSDADLLAEAGVSPIVSTNEAAEYFDRTSQWIYWGLKPDPISGEIRFVWPDGTPIVPDRVGDPEKGRRRFTPEILRAVLQSCYRRGNLTPEELKVIIRRIRYTELGVEWRQKEGWQRVYIGRKRHKWVKPGTYKYDRKAGVWKPRKVKK